MTRVQLRELAYARSGDKGDVCNVGIMAKSARIYEFLATALTPGAVREHYGDAVRGDVEIYLLPNIHSFSIVLRGGLDGGATTTLRISGVS